MARVSNNIFIDGLSGLFANVVFRQINGKTFMCRKPASPKTESVAQKANRDRFRMAMAYAKAALQNPVLRSFYASKITKGQSILNMAISDYSQPPVISDIIMDGYGGSIGDLIKMRVTDNGEVVNVWVQIFRNETLVEEGEAETSDGIHWKYISTVLNEQPGDVKIIIRAWDMTGRESVKEVNRSN